MQQHLAITIYTNRHNCYTNRHFTYLQHTHKDLLYYQHAVLFPTSLDSLQSATTPHTTVHFSLTHTRTKLWLLKWITMNIFHWLQILVVIAAPTRCPNNNPSTRSTPEPLLLFTFNLPHPFPSLLWHYWLGDRKGIRPVKKLDVGLLVMIWLELCTTYSSSSHHHLHHPLLQ